MSTDFYTLVSDNSTNTTWASAIAEQRRAGRVIFVNSARLARDLLRIQLAGPGIHTIPNDELEFTWADAAHTAPMSREGAVIALGLTWRAHPPHFAPEGAIVWLSESFTIGRRYWVTWEKGHDPFTQGAHVEDIT